MKYFTLDNTDGYSQSRLDALNEEFVIFAKTNGFNLDDLDEQKSATDKFHDEVMIYG